jgi:hypothetical protein
MTSRQAGPFSLPSSRRTSRRDQVARTGSTLPAAKQAAPMVRGGGLGGGTSITAEAWAPRLREASDPEWTECRSSYEILDIVSIDA